MNLSRPIAPPNVSQLPADEASFAHFQERLLESDEDLRNSYRLRYEVYCEEMRFLSSDDYPDGIETDAYDGHSLHFGSFNDEGAIVGTVRLVCGRELRDLPMREHCRLYPDAENWLTGSSPLAEISRLAVSKQYRRRATDGRYGLSLPPEGVRVKSTREDRRATFPTVLRLYRIMYHALKRRGTAHLIATMEATLQRSLRVLRFPFREIGPEVDYYGPVQPYYLNLDELDRRLLWTSPELLRYFNAGLESRFQSGALALKPR